MVRLVTRSDRSRCVLGLLSVLWLVLNEVHGGKVIFPESESPVEIPADENPEATDVDKKLPESRGLWESDLFFLQKLSGIFGGGDEDQKQTPSRQGGLRPELLPPQLAFSPNRRAGQGNQRTPPQRKVPVFRLPTITPPQQDLAPPHNSLQSASQNSIIRLPPPPQPPRSPLPPPSPPPRVSAAPVKQEANFPYQFELPAGLTPPAPSVPVYTPVQEPSRVDLPPQPSKPVGIKPSKQKKPTSFDISSDLVGASSITRKPQLLLPARPRPQLPQQQLISRPGTDHQNIFASGERPTIHQQHLRPAPQPQKQFPRPPPQPQRVVIQPEKPTVIHKKPIYSDFNPSPQEGSMLADAFQPVFVASPSMDDLDALGNDIMKPMIHLQERSAALFPSTTRNPPEFEDFF